MLNLLLFSLELVVLFFLSKRVQKRISFALYRLTRNKKVSIYVMALLFLPGTFVHEIAHFLSALFLLVPVGNLELMPKIEEENIKLGSVSIAKTDPMRRFFIGTAPFFFGTAIILSVIYFSLLYIPENFEPMTVRYVSIIIGALYLLFSVSNTMFSSKKDMEGLWLFIGIVFLLLFVIWMFGINVKFTFFYNSNLSEFFEKASLLLLVPLVLDIIALLILPKK